MKASENPVSLHNYICVYVFNLIDTLQYNIHA